MNHQEFLQSVKAKHNDLYWNLVGLVQDMKNGGGSLNWIINVSEDCPTTENLKKALYHINIAIDILHGTMYKGE